MVDSNLTGIQRFQNKWIGIAKGRTLVIGSKIYGDKLDRRTLYENALGLDMADGEGVDLVHDLEEPLPKRYGTFDHVDCFSVMEHCNRPWLMAKNIERLLVPNGTILLSVPFCWRVHGYPSDVWRMTTKALDVIFPRMGWFARGYAVDNKVRKIVPGKIDSDGHWMARAEMVAAGIKCK